MLLLTSWKHFLSPRLVLLKQIDEELYIDALNILRTQNLRLTTENINIPIGYLYLVIKSLVSLFSSPGYNTGVLLHAKTNSTNNKATSHKKVSRNFPLLSRMFSLLDKSQRKCDYTKHLGSSFSSSFFVHQSSKSLDREFANRSSKHLKNE